MRDKAVDNVDRLVWELRFAMLSQGIKQVTLAHDLGITQKHLSMIFNRKADPSMQLMLDMASRLGFRFVINRRPISVDALIAAAAHEPPPLENDPGWKALQKARGDG